MISRKWKNQKKDSESSSSMMESESEINMEINKISEVENESMISQSQCTDMNSDKEYE